MKKIKKIWKGWMLTYYDKDMNMETNVGKIYDDGCISGYIYIYPNKACARSDMKRAKWLKAKIVKVEVKVI